MNKAAKKMNGMFIFLLLAALFIVKISKNAVFSVPWVIYHLIYILQ